MNPTMAAFFDALNDGVVIVNPQGRVQYANVAGSTLLKAVPGQNFPDARVLKGLIDLVAGYLKPPVSIAIAPAAGAQDGQIATISPLPLPGTYAITIHNVQEKSFYETTLRNFFDFLDIDLAAPIERFSRGLESLRHQIPVETEDNPGESVLAEGRAISLCLQRLKFLAVLMKTKALVDQERLPIAEMVRDALEACSARVAARRLSVHVDGLDKELPPVYGSRSWLTRALAELIDNATRYSPETSALEISLRCTGTHVLVHFRNHGKFLPRHLGSHPVFVPFHMVALYLKQKRMPPRALVGREPDPTLSSGPGLGLPMCERIVALHGGKIQAPNLEDENVEFVLEIPTGAPTHGDEVLDIRQAQRYATDMATIMQRMRHRRERSG